MSSCSVLFILDSSHPFVIECDPLGEGIGVILVKKGHPIPFEKNITKIIRKRIIYLWKKDASCYAFFDQFLVVFVCRIYVVNIDHNILKLILGQHDLNDK